MTASDRIAEIRGKAGTVRIVRKSRKNSRVIPIDIATGQETGQEALVASDRLMNVRFFDELHTLPDQPTQQPLPVAESSHTIRISGTTWLILQRLTRPFETPDEVIRRFLPSETVTQ